MVTSINFFTPHYYIICYAFAEVQVDKNGIQYGLKCSSCETNPKGIIVNLNPQNGELELAKNELASSSLIC